MIVNPSGGETNHNGADSGESIPSLKVSRYDLEGCPCQMLKVEPPGDTYAMTKDGIMWQQPPHEPVLLSSFQAFIQRTISTDNGCKFLILAFQYGEPFGFLVPCDDFASMYWADEHIGGKTIVNSAELDRLAFAIKLFSECHVQWGCNCGGQS